jgi:hypothetical protein
MHSLGKTRIGIRTQAVGIYIVVASWFYSFWLFANDVKANHSLLSGAVLLFFPFIAATFTVILLISYFRSGRRHSGWVAVAAIATTAVCLRLLTMGL